MSFLSALNIAGSGLTAQKLRMDIISENVANINTTRTPDGGPYRRKMVVFEAKGNSFEDLFSSALSEGEDPGVRVKQVIEDETDFSMVYDPSHPDADENGYVAMPNVDLLKETIDMMMASRAYEANITSINNIKLIANKALEIR